MSTSIVPYLNFNGRCREAMTFYQQCFGGELSLQKVSETPMAAQMPSEFGAKIMHGTLNNGTLVLMGSDMMTGTEPGNVIGLCLLCASETDINRYFKNLSDGGKVLTPLHQTFWGGTYGEIADRYGLKWMVNYTRN